MKIQIAGLVGVLMISAVAPLAAADVEARTWPDAAAWEADLLNDPFVPRYRIVWDALPVPDGTDIEGMWFPYGYFAGIEFQKTGGEPGIVYHYDQHAWLGPGALGVEHEVTFLFGESLGGGDVWYEPVSSIGVRVASGTALWATAFDADEQLLGSWPLTADPSVIWGLVADDYIIGRLVIHDYGFSDWELHFPIVIGARVPEPTTAALLLLIVLPLWRRRCCAV